MGRTASTRIGLGAALAASAAGPAAAHTFGADGAGFAAGLGHPLFGLDHLLAMVAVGVWAAQLGGRATWQVPAAFVYALVLGAALALAGLPLPAVEPGIMASVLALGLLIAFAVRLPAPSGMALAALFALFHGHAHGAEIPAAADPLLYGAGFVLATVALHAAGIALGWGAARLLSPALTRAAGAAVATAGLWALLAAV
jgi:urease accessory protein